MLATKSTRVAGVLLGLLAAPARAAPDLSRSSINGCVFGTPCGTPTWSLGLPITLGVSIENASASDAAIDVRFRVDATALRASGCLSTPVVPDPLGMVQCLNFDCSGLGYQIEVVGDVLTGHLPVLPAGGTVVVVLVSSTAGYGPPQTCTASWSLTHGDPPEVVPTASASFLLPQAPYVDTVVPCGAATAPSPARSRSEGRRSTAPA